MVGVLAAIQSPATVQIFLISVTVCLSLSKVNCFDAVWNETILQSYNVFYASKKNCLYIYILKISLHACMLYAF